jgi:hypothetical protein
LNPTIFTSIGDWEKAPSTKLSAVVNIVQHILSSDDGPIPLVSRDGSIPSESSLKPLTGNNALQHQVVLYVEFSGTHKTIHSVGLHSLALSFYALKIFFVGVEGIWYQFKMSVRLGVDSETGRYPSIIPYWERRERLGLSCAYSELCWRCRIEYFMC